jgi:hypothetical protein
VNSYICTRTRICTYLVCCIGELQRQAISGLKVLIDSKSSIYNAKAFLWGMLTHVDVVLSALCNVLRRYVVQ